MTKRKVESESEESDYTDESDAEVKNYYYIIGYDYTSNTCFSYNKHLSKENSNQV